MDMCLAFGFMELSTYLTVVVRLVKFGTGCKHIVHFLCIKYYL